MTFEQYPHKLYTETETGGGTDENGFPIPSTKEWVFHCMCRESPAGSSNIISTESGEATSFSSVIVAPLGTEPIKTNTKVKIEFTDGTAITSKVIRFTTRNLHVRLWI